MIVYFSILLISIFSSFITTYGKDIFIRKFFKLLTFLSLLIPLIIRKDIGTDYQNYVAIFNSIKIDSFVFSDIGWFLINKAVILLGLGVQAIFIVSGFVTLYLFYSKLKNEELFSSIILFLTFLYFPSYNIIRQIFAVCIIFFAFKIEGNKFENILLYIFAFSIHFSSIIFLPLFLFKQHKIKKYYHNSYLFFGVIIFIIFRFIPIKILIAKVIGVFDPRLGTYVISDKYSNKIDGTGLTLYFEVLFYCFLYYRIDINKISQICFNRITFLFIIGMLIYGAIFNYFIFSRFKFYFYLLPLMCLNYIKKDQITRFIYVCFMLLLFFVSIRSNIIMGDNGILPYTSIL